MKPRLRRGGEPPAPTRVALCGAGMIAGAHGVAARRLGWEVVAVASRTEASAARRAAEVGGRVVRYTDLPAGADVVVVATPPGRHAADALRLLAAGAAVVLEKPLCTTLADADAVVAAAGRRLLYAENLAYAPVVRAMLGRRPVLGALGNLEVRAITPRPTWGDFLTPGWGGGVLFDLGAHPLAVALLLAAPARVVAVEAHLDEAPDHHTDEHAVATLVFDTGLRARVEASWRGTSVLWDAQAASLTGVLRAELLPEPELEHDGEPVPLPAPPPDLPELTMYGYEGQLAAFAADLAAGRVPAMDAAFGRLVLDVTCAAYASARAGGEPVSVPFTGPRDATPLELWRGRH